MGVDLVRVDLKVPNPLNIPDASKVNDSTVTRKVLQELNSSFKSECNQSFTDLMVKHCSKREEVVKKESNVLFCY